MLTLEVLSLFIHSCLYDMFVKCEQNRIVQTTDILSFLTKKKNPKTKQKQQQKKKTGFQKHF